MKILKAIFKDIENLILGFKEDIKLNKKKYLILSIINLSILYIFLCIFSSYRIYKGDFFDRILSILFNFKFRSTPEIYFENIVVSLSFLFFTKHFYIL